MSISSKKPLYYQLKQTLLKWIEGGDYPPGSILPSEKQLQDSFGISRTTVRMALWRLERIRMADSVPIATEVNYIPAALVPNMEAQLAQNQSFYSCLEEEYGIIIVYARERVECRLANMRESRHLGIPKGSAILYVERQTFGYRKSRPMELFPVEFVKMSYNAEKYTFHQIIRKE